MIEAVRDYTINAAALGLFWFVLPGAWFTGLYQAVVEGSFFWFVLPT